VDVWLILFFSSLFHSGRNGQGESLLSVGSMSLVILTSVSRLETASRFFESGRFLAESVG
jgi:hypothetical protein